jgi:hypothetical protein
MPLIGFSAQLIPYVMAMFFTMIFLNGDKLTKAEKQKTKTLSVSANHTIFNKNPNATPNSYHYENHSNTHFDVCEVTDIFQNRRVCSLNPSSRNIFSHSCPTGTFSHRGPPCLVA